MRAAVIGLLLAGCSTGVDVIGVPDLDRPDPLRGLCLRVEPTTVVLDGTVAVEERAPATVTLTVPTADCVEPFVEVTAVDLDDPFEAFDLQAPDLPRDMNAGETDALVVSMLATEPGTYEGQVNVHGFGSFGAATLAVQLFGEVPEPE